MSDENKVETVETPGEDFLGAAAEKEQASADQANAEQTEATASESTAESAPETSLETSPEDKAAAATAAAEQALGLSDPAEANGAGAGEAADNSEQTAEEATEADYRRRLREFTRELKKQPGKWYIIQCYSGYENKVKTNLDMRAQTLEVEDSIFDVVVPVEQVEEKKDGKKKIVKKKLLPGYVLVRMELNDAAWSVVRDTPGVTSFVGNEGNATPVKIRDVAKFLMPNETISVGEAAQNQAAGEQAIAMPEKEKAKAFAHDFEVGEAVTILSGPLASVSATISEIDAETGKMQGLVSIFGRETPVELSPTEIERIS